MAGQLICNSQGTTLQSDPEPRWNELPSSEKSKSEPISFRQVRI